MTEEPSTLTVRGPSLHPQGTELLVRATFAPPGGAVFPVSWWVPVSIASWVRPTLDVWVPLAITLAAARGWDLTLRGPVDETLATANKPADPAPGTNGGRPPQLNAEETVAAVTPRESNEGRHGLCFAADLASWASLAIASGRIAPPPGEWHPGPVDDLVVVEASLVGARERADLDPIHAAARAAETARVATSAPLPRHSLRAEIDATGTEGRDALGDPALVAALIAGAGLLLGNGLATWTIPGPGTTRPIASWSTARTRLTHYPGATDLVTLAHLVGHDPAVTGTLRSCGRTGDGTNCGRCGDCLATMTALAKAGAPAPAFPAPLTPAAVLAADASAARWADELGPHLDTDDELAASWAIHRSEGRRRHVSAGTTIGLTGPDAWSRLAATMPATGQRPEPPGTTPAALMTDPLVVGWGPGQVPLRPRADRVTAIRARWRGVDEASTGPLTSPPTTPSPGAGEDSRPIAWAILEPADPERRHDTGAAELTLAAESVWGPGRVYLTGLGWSENQAGVMDRWGRARLLGATATRLWWRDEGDLDALRLMECAEAGCAGRQVMPPGAALTARRRLPPVLAPVVVTVEELSGLSPRDRTWFAGVVDWLTTGSLERDLAHEAAAHPAPPDRAAGEPRATR